MTLAERIEHAEKMRDEVLSNGTLKDLTYWNGYLNALRAVELDLKVTEAEVYIGIQEKIPQR